MIFWLWREVFLWILHPTYVDGGNGGLPAVHGYSIPEQHDSSIESAGKSESFLG